MSEVKLQRGYLKYGDTEISVGLTIEDIDKRIEFYSTEIANLLVIRDYIEGSAYEDAVNAMRESSMTPSPYNDRFIEGYMAALGYKDESD